jgi:hypothetical protein
VLVDANDALHSAPREVQDRYVSLLKQWYPRVDYFFCGYGIASHFPHCYRIQGVDRPATARRRQQFFNEQWARLVDDLQPRFAFPSAADVALLDRDIFFVNEAVHAGSRPIETLRKMFPGCKSEAFDAAPGFRMADGQVTDAVVRTKFSSEVLADELRVEAEQVNSVVPVDSHQVDDVIGLLAESIEMSRKYLVSFPGDYVMGIRLMDADAEIRISKRQQSISVEKCTAREGAFSGMDLLMTTRLEYLRDSLTSEFGHEILFVGSGCVFDYLSKDRIDEQLQRELMVIVTKQDTRLDARRKDNNLVRLAKSAVRAAVPSLRPFDPYDIRNWIVWSE